MSCNYVFNARTIVGLECFLHGNGSRTKLLEFPHTSSMGIFNINEDIDWGCVEKIFIDKTQNFVHKKYWIYYSSILQYITVAAILQK